MKKICEICNNEFDTLITINGIKHNLRLVIECQQLIID